MKYVASTISGFLAPMAEKVNQGYNLIMVFYNLKSKYAI